MLSNHPSKRKPNYDHRIGFYSEIKVIDENKETKVYAVVEPALGIGTHGKVSLGYLIVDGNIITNQSYAIKEFKDILEEDKSFIEEEIKIFREFYNGAELVEANAKKEDKSKGTVAQPAAKFYGVFPFLGGVITKPQFNYREMVTVANEIAQWLYHFHKMNFVHGDIKSTNILVDMKERISSAERKRVNALKEQRFRYQEDRIQKDIDQHFGPDAKQIKIEREKALQDFKKKGVRTAIPEKKSKKIFRVSPVDFGTSFKDDKKEINRITAHPAEMVGVSTYFPPETKSGLFGEKTDIYMFVPVIAQLFGAVDTYQPKIDAKGSEGFFTPFDLKGMEPLPQILNVNISNLVVGFLNRMQDPDYDKRPEPNEILRFFNTLHLLIETHCLDIELMEESKAEIVKRKKVLLAQLCIVELGLWNSEIGSQKLETGVAVRQTHEQKEIFPGQEIKLFEKKKESAEHIAFNFEHYDFANNTRVCDLIVKLKEHNMLTPNIAKSLVSLRVTPGDPKDMADIPVNSHNLYPRRKLIELAALTKNWIFLARLLAASSPLDPSIEANKELLNKHRHEIALGFVEYFRQSPNQKSAEEYEKIIKGENALGALLKKPTNAFFFFLSRREHTASMDIIIDACGPVVEKMKKLKDADKSAEQKNFLI